MTTYNSDKNMFQYTITNNSNSYSLDSDDYSILSEAFNKWNNMLTPDTRFSNNYTIQVSFEVNSMDTGILGGASVQTIYYFGTFNFGDIFTASANITMNDLYLNSMKNSIRDDGKSTYYHVMLHEIGHVLGIGVYWSMSGAPVTTYVENNTTKYYYTGQNALREYTSYIPDISHTIIGIPIEDNGGSGTQNVHAEEGDEGIVSSDDRYINGVFHPGLNTELMTGWMDGYPVSTPLSRISLGFLHDMGFGVDYSQADNFSIQVSEDYIRSVINSSNWLDLTGITNKFRSSYTRGFIDISGGTIRTRNQNDHLFISGDVSFNQKLYVAGDISWNKSSIQNESINISSIIDNSLLGPTGNDGMKGDKGFDGSNSIYGLQGIAGPTGPTGQDGSQGSNGEIGYTGEKGETGSDGLSGSVGLIGPTGSFFVNTNPTFNNVVYSTNDVSINNNLVSGNSSDNKKITCTDISAVSNFSVGNSITHGIYGTKIKSITAFNIDIGRSPSQTTKNTTFTYGKTFSDRDKLVFQASLSNNTGNANFFYTLIKSITVSDATVQINSTATWSFDIVCSIVVYEIE